MYYIQSQPRVGFFVAQIVKILGDWQRWWNGSFVFEVEFKRGDESVFRFSQDFFVVNIDKRWTLY
jgi:hypothetical protein